MRHLWCLPLDVAYIFWFFHFNNSGSGNASKFRVGRSNIDHHWRKILVSLDKSMAFTIFSMAMDTYISCPLFLMCAVVGVVCAIVSVSVVLHVHLCNVYNFPKLDNWQNTNWILDAEIHNSAVIVLLIFWCCNTMEFQVRSWGLWK